VYFKNEGIGRDQKQCDSAIGKEMFNIKWLGGIAQKS